MKSIILLSIFVAAFFSNDERREEGYYLAHAKRYYDEVAHFFSHRSEAELENLMQHQQPRISVLAAWILCQKKCLQTEDENRRLEYRAEFLGFLSGKLDIVPPKWWKDAVRKFAATDEVRKVEFDLPITYPDGFHVKHETVCPVNIKPVTLETDFVQFLEDGKDVTIKHGENWEYGDCFFREGDIARALTTTVLPDGRRIVGVASALDTLNVFCVTANGTKLWRAELGYHLESAMGGETGIDIEYQLVHAIATPNEVALFWICRDAISLNLLDINTGEDLFLFSTYLTLPK